jgi:gamma-glutamyltranspeptidase/glutathione hydrolase
MNRLLGSRVRRAGLAAVAAALLLTLAIASAPSAHQTIFAPNGAVTAGHPLAAQAGLRILLQGGNAIDAAIATAATLTVVMPDMTGPLGSGYAVIYLARSGETVVVDMNGVAPRAASGEKLAAAMKQAGMSQRVRSGPMVRGPLSATVPGNLRGWEAMLDRYGKLSFKEVLQPAIEYAEKGRPLDIEGAFHIRRYIPEIGIYPTWAQAFLVNGNPPPPGHRIVLKDLAQTYKKVAAMGADVVYRGEIAKEIARFFKEEGGWITEEDLAAYRVQWKAPITTTYRGYTVHGAPPSSSAITWMQALKILEGVDLKALGHNSAAYLHTVIEASKLAYLDGYRYVGDPDFVPVPVERLLSAEYAAELRGKIGDRAFVPQRHLAYTRPAGPVVGHSTTHMNVVDAEGNVVSMTNTLGTFFGCGMVVGTTGMLCSDGIDWFDVDKSPWTGQRSATVIEPGKRNRWTLSPAILFKDGKPFMAVGGAGAETTMSGILQPILNVIDFGMDIQRANDAPRFVWGDVIHYTAGTRLALERAISDEVRKALAEKGHELVSLTDAPNPLVGNTNAIVYDPKTGAIMAGANVRGRDAAAGY